MSDKSAIDIVAEWLKENDYDGLVNGDSECGCPLNNLASCEDISGDGGMKGNCHPAYRVEVPPEQFVEGYDEWYSTDPEGRIKVEPTEAT